MSRADYQGESAAEPAARMILRASAHPCRLGTAAAIKERDKL
jgi:hypothetical protein